MKLDNDKVTKIDFKHCWNNNLMPDCNCAVKKFIPTPVATDNLVDDNAPDVTQIPDDSSVDSLLFSRDSESEGGIWDDTNNNDVSFALREVIEMLFHPITKGLGLQWLVQDPNPAPEGTRRQCGKAKQYPLAIWQCGADGKLERISLDRNTRNSIAICLH